MNPADARVLTNNLLTTHGLSKQGWKHGWNDSCSAFGMCDFNNQTILLSFTMVKLNDEENVKSTILHEIAHALCGPGVNHSQKWKAKLLEIGGDGKRCYGDEVIRPEPQYLYRCPNGHEEKFYRKNSRLSCSLCSPKFDERYLFKLVNG